MFGIQFPMTIRPPGRVTRTISFATSKGLGANIAPKMLTTRSKLRSFRSCRLEASYSPPPPQGFISPMTWGIESNVIERFAAAGVAQENIAFAKDTYTFNFAGSPSEFVDAFQRYYGPTMNAFEAAEKNGRAAELQKELEALFSGQNKSSSKQTTSIPATYLRVTVTVN